jgi:hypothetical protein
MGTRNPTLHEGITAELNRTVYTFTLNSFKITDTRSVHKDSDYVSVAVAVGANPPITLPAKSMGDLNNGTFAVNLSIPNVAVPAATVVAFSYSIVNSGHAKDSVSQALQKVVSAAASKAASAGAGALGGVLGGPLGAGIATVGTAAAGWVIGKLQDIVFANCDGIVAAGDHVYTGAQLAEKTSGGKVLTVTDDNKGTDSAHGCGGNSHYFVTWSIAAHAAAPLTATAR